MLLNPWVLLTLLISLLLLYQYVDLSLTLAVSQIPWLWHVEWMEWVTLLGSGYMSLLFICAFVLFRYLCMHPLWEKRSLFVLLTVVISGLSCDVLKMVFGRARPTLWFEQQAYGFYWLKTNSTYWSFPSGHTATILSIAFSLSILFPRYRFFFLAIGLLVAFSRICLGCHYLSDVMMASYMALLGTALSSQLLFKQTVQQGQLL